MSQDNARLGNQTSQESTSETTYRVKYATKKSWGKGMEETTDYVRCERIEVVDGLVRFITSDGNDEKAISATRMITYEKTNL